MISAKFVPLKYYTLSSQLRRLTSFSVGCSGRGILSPGQIAVMRKWSIGSDHSKEPPQQNSKYGKPCRLLKLKADQAVVTLCNQNGTGFRKAIRT